MSRYFEDIDRVTDAVHLEARKRGFDMPRATARRMVAVAMEVYRGEVTEEPQWWDWNAYYGKWEPSRLSPPAVSITPFHDAEIKGRVLTHVTVYGTTADRDAKRDALLEAARKAGKP